MDFDVGYFFKLFFKRLFISIALGLVIYFAGFLTGLIEVIDYHTLGSIAAVVSLLAAVSIDRGREDVPKTYTIHESNRIPYERVFGSFFSYFAFLYILINYFPMVYGRLCNFDPIFDIPFIIIAVIIILIEVIHTYLYFSRK